MDKKGIYISLAICLLFLVGSVGFIYAQNNESITVGHTNFELPEGYYKVDSNNLGDITITNGNNSVFIAEYNDTDIYKHVDELDEYVTSTNRSSVIDEFTMNDVFVCKLTVVNDTNSSFYWFEDDGEVFSLYTWDGNPQIESILDDFIISSIEE